MPLIADRTSARLLGPDGCRQVLFDGKPFVIKGAGGNGSISTLVGAGGNSVRTWGVEHLPATLAAARSHGVSVTAGIWLRHRCALDYADREKVAKQTEEVRAAVSKYRDDPAVLMWGIGNEMENGYNEPELWEGVQAAAHAAKSVDPNRPVMTAVAEVSQEKIDLIKHYAPDIDILGVNSYGELPTLGERLKQFGWTKPYVVTGFGPIGHWERPKTAWGAPVEQSSTEKASSYQEGLEATVGSPPESCLGSYAFLWGAKQEVTPTWFGMMLGTGELTEAVDVIQKAWTGAWPAHRAPRIDRFDLADDRGAFTAGSLARAVVAAAGEGLTYRWEVTPEVTDLRADGTGEVPPDPVDVQFKSCEAGAVTFYAPATPGPFRLYVYVLSATGRAATANIPFQVC
ncbi:MAG: glycoside hydrolase family 2 TIM barrel-domain containing protein [Fimbriimonadaceae bacterium]